MSDDVLTKAAADAIRGTECAGYSESAPGMIMAAECKRLVALVREERERRGASEEMRINAGTLARIERAASESARDRLVSMLAERDADLALMTRVANGDDHAPWCAAGSPACIACLGAALERAKADADALAGALKGLVTIAENSPGEYCGACSGFQSDHDAGCEVERGRAVLISHDRAKGATAKAPCGKCGGTGSSPCGCGDPALPRDHRVSCPDCALAPCSTCGGVGVVNVYSLDKTTYTERPCPDCAGGA